MLSHTSHQRRDPSIQRIIAGSIPLLLMVDWLVPHYCMTGKHML